MTSKFYTLVDIEEAFASLVKFNQISEMSQVKSYLTLANERDLALKLNMALIQKVLPKPNANLEGFFLRNALLSQKSLRILSRYMKPLEKQQEVIEVSNGEAKIYCHTCMV